MTRSASADGGMSLVFADVSNKLTEYINSSEPGSVDALPHILDGLAMSMHQFTVVDEISEGMEQIEPEFSYTDIRGKITQKCPFLGMYNVVSPLSESIGEGDAVVGDSVDDLADIMLDLEKSRIMQKDMIESDASYWIRFLYLNHWERHLRQLQYYLYELKVDTGDF